MMKKMIVVNELVNLIILVKMEMVIVSQILIVMVLGCAVETTTAKTVTIFLRRSFSGTMWLIFILTLTIVAIKHAGQRLNVMLMSMVVRMTMIA